MRFVSDDGKFFDTEEECKKHEKEIKNGRKKQERDIAAIKTVLDTYKDFLDEIDKLHDTMADYIVKADDLIEHVDDLIDQYNEKYDDSVLRIIVDEDDEGNEYLKLVKCDGNCKDCEGCYD